jgi:hypothetical protein
MKVNLDAKGKNSVQKRNVFNIIEWFKDCTQYHNGDETTSLVS